MFGFEAQYIRPEMRSSNFISTRINRYPTICICLGGFSPWNMVQSIIAQLALLDAEFLHIILIKSFDTKFDQISDLRNFSKGITFEYQENIDLVIQNNFHIDLFVIGGGFLKFELLHLGEPFLIYPIIDHQKKLVKKMEGLVGVDLEFNRVMAQMTSIQNLKFFVSDRRKYLERFQNFFSREGFFSRLGF